MTAELSGFILRSISGAACADNLPRVQSVLESPVLVLNRLWQAVNVCSARRAFNLLYEGHAQVVDADADHNYLTHDFESWCDVSNRVPESVMLHGVTISMRVPRIIVLLFFDRLPKKQVKFTRHNVFERDHDTCQYCGRVFDRTDLNLDHVIPRDKGGLTTWENVVCSCIRCNTRKGNKLAHEVSMALIRKPKCPKWQPLLHLTWGGQPHESWKHFVDVAYWNVELSD